MDSKVRRAIDYWDRMAADTLDEVAAVDRTDERLRGDIGCISELMPLKPDSYILDICCGNGLISLSIAERVQRVVGLDGSKSMVNMSKRVMEGKGCQNVDILRGEALSLPFKDNSFDGILCFDAFHYFPDCEYARNVVREILRVAKPTATILLTKIPSRDSIGYHVWNLIRSRRKGYDAPLPKVRGKRSGLERVSLLFRRLTAKKVDSDEWLWYKKNFFEGFRGVKFSEIKVFPSHHAGEINYRFDVLISN